MGRNAEVNVGFRGDDDQLQRTFDDVGAGARDMARDIERSTDDTAAGFDRLSGGVDGSESKFRGFGDTISGTGDIMAGFKEGNLVGVAMGFADLAGGLSDFVLPAFMAVRGFIMTSLMPALTAIVVHPLFLAILAGGAIIAGLFLLEKKFGVVTKAVGFVKDALTDAWNWISSNWSLIADILTTPFLGAFRLISKAWNMTLGGFRFGFSVPDWIPVVGGKSWDFQLPTMPTFTFHTGGVVPGPAGMNVPAILQAGETVIPRGQRSGMTVVVNVSGVGMGRDFGDAVARALRDNRLIGVTA